MAKRIDIANDIKNDFGNFLNIAEVGKYLGFCYRKTKAFLTGLDCYDTGKEKKYLAIDISKRLDNLSISHKTHK